MEELGELNLNVTKLERLVKLFELQKGTLDTVYLRSSSTDWKAVINTLHQRQCHGCRLASPRVGRAVEIVRHAIAMREARTCELGVMCGNHRGMPKHEV